MTKSVAQQDIFDAKIANQVGKLTTLIADQKGREEQRKAASRKAVLVAFDTWLTKAPDAERHSFVAKLAETVNQRNKGLIAEFLDTLEVEEVDEVVASEPKVVSAAGKAEATDQVK